jgi:hypothetical protein
MPPKSDRSDLLSPVASHTGILGISAVEWRILIMLMCTGEVTAKELSGILFKTKPDSNDNKNQ